MGCASSNGAAGLGAATPLKQNKQSKPLPTLLDQETAAAAAASGFESHTEQQRSQSSGLPVRETSRREVSSETGGDTSSVCSSSRSARTGLTSMAQSTVSPNWDKDSSYQIAGMAHLSEARSTLSPVPSVGDFATLEDDYTIKPEGGGQSEAAEKNTHLSL
eukprot:TRINITY_DN13063_c1_g2_i1.p1 TRINITY_DN13063_c1_g2~~TRINITY_DN13063_c1_g2_i1.p1  ORF type:complete len:171 (+),score=26.45 TRINITY_DN13063_c1_g2_i1:32-514(+)